MRAAATATQRLARLAEEPPQPAAFGDLVLEAVGPALGHDGFCLFAVDPCSGIRTTMFSRHGLSCASSALLENESRENDANRYAELLASGRHAGRLTASGRAGSRSRRLRELMRADGYTSELRVVLADDAHYWGALSLFRDERHHPFTDDDVEVARSLVRPLSWVLRRHQVTGVRRPGPQPEAGVAMVSRDHTVTFSREARAWLALLEDPGEEGAVIDDLVRMVLEVASSARAGAHGCVARVRAASGSWLVASGTEVGEDVAVVLRPGDVRTVLPAFARWSGLSARETEVVADLTRGRTTRLIARDLGISPMTVDDHLRSAYRKTRVAGRDELLALLR